MSSQVLIAGGTIPGLATAKLPPASSVPNSTGLGYTDAVFQTFPGLQSSEWRLPAGCGSERRACWCHSSNSRRTADLYHPKSERRTSSICKHGFLEPRRGNASGRGQVCGALVSSAGGATLDEEARAEVAQSDGAAISEVDLELVKEEVLKRRSMETLVGKLIINCRFFTLAGVFGSLAGSLLCFLKGTYYVNAAIIGYVMMIFNMPNRCKVVLKLIEALDTYLVGTVMLIFGMGLYELFVMKLDGTVDAKGSGSTLFGLFPLEKRPAWLAIQGLDDLKTKLGHVIVMILLVGMFEKSKIVHPTCSLDLLYTAGAVLLCAGSLFLLSRLKHDTKPGGETTHLH